MRESNYNKLNFGRMLSGYDGDKNNHGDCFHYGSVGGCDEYCPALREGNCEVPQENADLIRNDEELLEMYPGISPTIEKGKEDE